jgi:hypothetical protein
MGFGLLLQIKNPKSALYKFALSENNNFGGVLNGRLVYVAGVFYNGQRS